MAAAAILIFQIHKILLVDGVQRAETHHRAKFHKNQLWRYCHFSRSRPSAILDLFGAYLDNPCRVLYHFAKFGYDRCSSFDNINISICGTFGW